MKKSAKRKAAAGKEREKTPSSGSCISNYVFWTDSCGETLEKVWSKIPASLGQLIATIAMFILGLTVRGEWLLFAAYFVKYLQSGGEGNYIEETDELIESMSDWFAFRFKGYVNVLVISTLISYLTYFGIGGFLHWYYYVGQRDRSHEWKCQPNKFLTPDSERFEIFIGSLSLVFGSAISAAISTYIANGGPGTKVYFQPGEFGYIWLVLQIPLVFMYQDYMTYWFHRTFHTPFLYKNFHKLHHTWKQPTAFSVTAIHPVEFVIMQCVLLSPLVMVPIYWLNMCILFAYIYYHGIIDHSGINFKRYWWQPWQPDCIFHDNHHQYFHVNFGFNIEYWDTLHGTNRRKDRIYREDIFYGQGKSLEDASSEELRLEREERESENPLAFSKNTHEFKLE